MLKHVLHVKLAFANKMTVYQHEQTLAHAHTHTHTHCECVYVKYCTTPDLLPISPAPYHGNRK
jgi:hypothetical protein